MILNLEQEFWLILEEHVIVVIIIIIMLLQVYDTVSSHIILGKFVE